MAAAANSSPSPTSATSTSRTVISNSPSILQALRDFDAALEKDALGAVPPAELSEVMHAMKRYGVPVFPWKNLVGLMSYCLNKCLDQFRESHENDSRYGKHLSQDEYNDYKHRLLLALGDFDGAPFTLQRICELILEPEEHYRNLDKLLFGLEKLLSVSTVLETASDEDLAKLQVASDEVRKKEDVSSKSLPNSREVVTEPIRTAQSGDVSMSDATAETQSEPPPSNP